MIQIRSYEPADLEVLAELMGYLGYPTTIEVMQSRMARVESNPDYYTFVAVCDNVVVGMAGVQQRMNYETDDRVTYISALVVNPAYQGRGVGTKLISYVEDWAISERSTILYLTSGIKEERKRAHEFYKRYGFDLTGYRFVKKLK